MGHSRWVNAGPLDKDVVEALGSLPGVNELELLFVKTSPGDTLRFSSSMLAKLRSISLQFRHPVPSLTRRNLVALNSETKNSVSYLVASSPCLEHLCIGPEEIRPLGLVSMMARGDSAQNNPLSLLRSVTAIAIDLPLQPKYIPFLKDLTSLELPNNREKDQQLWSAFRASKFKLKAIKVEIPSSQLIDYLLSYRGLETFHLGGRASDIVESLYGSPGDQSVRLLQSALYEQRMSLRDLRRTESNPSLVTYGTTYVASIELLRPLHRFRHLERLDFVYSIGLRGPLVSSTLPHPSSTELTRCHCLQTAALDMLAALSPKLKTACFTILRPEKSYLRRRSRGRNLFGSGLHMEEVLRPLSEGYCFKIRPARWQELRVVFRSLEPDYIQIPAIPLRVYRAVYEVVEEAGQYRLVLDPVATELLNEGGACLRDEDAILT